jgi:hypothetical protein
MQVAGRAIAYRLYDVGYAVSLGRVQDLLASSAPERVRLIRGDAAALQIPNPPIAVVLGSERIIVDGQAYDAEVSARVFDFGVASLRLMVTPPGEMSWAAFTAFGRAVDGHTEIPKLLDHHLHLLCDRIRPAITKGSVAPVREDYVVFRLQHLHSASGAPVTLAAELATLDVAPLLLGESRPLSESARRELLPHQFSYYDDDLAVLTWDNALIVDPAPGPTDVESLLEFANAQLLELRYYDAVLDIELQRLNTRVESTRGSRLSPFTNRYSRLLEDIQRLYSDSTELVERVENALKVTDDVYLAKIYAAALDIFRGRAWRADVDRKLALLRDTYEMLNGMAHARRAEALETAIVLLIVAEIVLAFFR